MSKKDIFSYTVEELNAMPWDDHLEILFEQLNARLQMIAEEEEKKKKEQEQGSKTKRRGPDDFPPGSAAPAA